MHRHGYKGRKLHRDTAQRKALLRGLAISLIEHGKIETTLPRAKELVPFIEPLITKAKRADLPSRRAIIATLDNRPATYRLMDELVGQMGGRNSGHVRITRTRFRVGDHAQLASVSFVDDLKTVEAKPVTASAVKKPTAKKTPAKTKVAGSSSPAPTSKSVKATDKHLSQKPTVNVRKTGDR